MNQTQGLVLIIVAAVVMIAWVRAGDRRDAARLASAAHAADDLALPSQHSRHRAADDAWLLDVQSWGDDLDGTAVVRRQTDVIATGDVYATVSATTAAQRARLDAVA